MEEDDRALPGRGRLEVDRRAVLVGVDIERVVVVGGRRGWILAGAGA